MSRQRAPVKRTAQRIGKNGCGESRLSAEGGVPSWYRLGSAGHVETQATSTLRLLFALAWFNSLPVDWMARFMIQIHANKTYLFSLPTPQPTDAEILANTDYATLAQNALRLTLAASWDDFAERAPLFHVHKQDVPQTAKAKDALRTESDQIVARLYGITPAEFAHKTKAASCTAHRH